MNDEKRSIIKEAWKYEIDTPMSYSTLTENIGKDVSEAYGEVEQTTEIDFNDILIKKWAYKYRYNTFHDKARIQYAVSRYEYVHNSDPNLRGSLKNERSLAIGYTLVTPIAPDEFYDRPSIKDVYLDLEMRRT